MTRAVGAALLAHFQGGGANRAACVMLKARDGTRIGFTTRDVAVSANIGIGAETYAKGLTLSELVLASGLDASYFEMSGPIGPALTRAAIEGGRWNDAEAWLFWMSPDVANEIAPLLYGRVREAVPAGQRFTLEARGEQDRFNQTVGGVLSVYCDVKTYGDSRCQAVVETLAATVTSVTDDMRFNVSFAGTFATGYFAPGTLTFTSGPLAGAGVTDIYLWTSLGAGAASIELIVPFVEAPQVGNTLTVRRDCPRTRVACMARNNILNFRGEPDLFGSDELLRAQIPGTEVDS